MNDYFENNAIDIEKFFENSRKINREFSRKFGAHLKIFAAFLN